MPEVPEVPVLWIRSESSSSQEAFVFRAGKGLRGLECYAKRTKARPLPQGLKQKGEGVIEGAGCNAPSFFCFLAEMARKLQNRLADVGAEFLTGVDTN
jgi:hypothetical protein